MKQLKLKVVLLWNTSSCTWFQPLLSKQYLNHTSSCDLDNLRLPSSPLTPSPTTHSAFCGLYIFLLMKLKCLCVIISSVFGWLSDTGRGKIMTLLINHVVYTSVLTLCFSLTESFHQLFIVLHASALKTSAKILGKVQLPWCITENAMTTIRLQQLGWIKFSSYTFSQFQNSALSRLHASSCISPFQWGFIFNGLNQKI